MQNDGNGQVPIPVIEFQSSTHNSTHTAHLPISAFWSSEGRCDNHTRPTPDQLANLVNRFSPSRADAPRNAWVKIDMAIHDADSGDFGYGLLEAFSQQSSKFKPKDCQATWTSFKSGKVTVVTLIELANEDSPLERATAEPSKRGYTSLREYAERHGAPLEAFTAAGWRETTHIITCAKILPLWEFPWPRSLLPHQLLAHMAAYLIHTATLVQVEQSADRLLSWLETHSADPFEHSGHGVGLVAYKAYEALETVVGQGDGDRSAEAHAGVCTWFAAHTAALVHPLQEQQDPIRRRNFWERWLMRAIPICLQIPNER